ncbi:unnamed protein product [Kuraishia capsulata CBS 1993]|uniref:PPM-type phosphatase domain-containing protein n=1 Tax=Kuraishia capsulata CBS 1993 TaxID=1382522 RepID=W6MI11_9ASCO|nr:uncharacterized protein KUCA_T00001970001 [Kuraishia capsulata CBS 1993]CDK25999.1 unnamed protein product [Kuraishia capsulata CBS 1993]
MLAIHVPRRLAAGRGRMLGARRLSQRLSVKLKDSNIVVNVNLMKVPSNYGYYSSRVNRLYNEDKFSASIIEVDMAENRVAIGPDTNEELDVASDLADIDPYAYELGPHSGGKRPVKVFNFNVFDGHGGEECSDYLTHHLSQNVESLHVTSGAIEKLFKDYAKSIGGYWRRWVRRQNTHFEQILSVTPQERNLTGSETLLREERSSRVPIWEDESFFNVSGEDFLKLRIFLSFLYTDLRFLSQEKAESGHHSGSTCTSAFIYTIDPDPTDCHSCRSGSEEAVPFDDVFFYEPNVLSKLVIAHVGDTRAILCDKEGVAHALTVNHHPSNPLESRRLARFSTGLMMTDSFGEERFINYANTRSFGDITGKNVGISAEPEFREVLLGDAKKMQKYRKQHRDKLAAKQLLDFGGNECFLVLVSDGITNYLSDQEVVDLIMSTTNNLGAIKGTPHVAAKEVVKFVECIGGDDNATCNIVKLSGWGNWPMLDRTGKLREEKMESVSRADRG